MDEDGKINGGEWLGNSCINYLDFFWLFMGVGGGNLDVSLDKVCMLLEKFCGFIVDTMIVGVVSDLLIFDNFFEF